LPTPIRRRFELGGVMGDETKDEKETPSERPGEQLGNYLKSVRAGTTMTLRDVEEATGKQVSNAYLSQLENGRIAKPSPNALHALSSVYGISYANLMERAGYINPVATRSDAQAHGRLVTSSIENLTKDEEQELLKYLSYYRSQRAKN
jgi:transcriptional regulator with XRE-family HTH domain